MTTIKKSKRTLTQADVDFLKNTFATKSDLDNSLDKQEQKFEAKITEFKDEFYTKIDPILKEVVASREERIMCAEQHRRNQDRIEKLEKVHPQGRHLSAI